MFDYKAKPFYLSDEDIQWVESTYQSMTQEEKIGQLFCPIEFSTREEELKIWWRKSTLVEYFTEKDVAKKLWKATEYCKNTVKFHFL